MWAWCLGGWCALSVLLAAALHVVRRRGRGAVISPELGAFVRAFEEELRARHPHVVANGLLPGKLVAVLTVDGQEVAVPLHEVFRRWLAFPEGMAATIARLLDEVRDSGLARPQDHAFEHVATRILPQIRTVAWACRQGTFGDSAVVHRALHDDLAVCYAIDDGQSIVFVCRAHLRQWQREEEDLFRLAVANLRRAAGGDLGLPARGNALCRYGDGYDAPRLLLLWPERVEGLLLGMPERDVVWLADVADGEGGHGGERARAGAGTGAPAAVLERVAREVEERYADAQHPVSPHLYRMSGGVLARVSVRAAAP